VLASGTQLSERGLQLLVIVIVKLRPPGRPIGAATASLCTAQALARPRAHSSSTQSAKGDFRGSRLGPTASRGRQLARDASAASSRERGICPFRRDVRLHSRAHAKSWAMHYGKHTRTHTHTHTHTHKQTRTCDTRDAHKHTHTHKHTYTKTHNHTQTHSNTRTMYPHVQTHFLVPKVALQDIILLQIIIITFKMCDLTLSEISYFLRISHFLRFSHFLRSHTF